MSGKRDLVQTKHQNLGLQKKTPPASLPSHLLENAWVEYAFPYALSPHHEGAKWNTIEVARRASAKLPHCVGHVLAYLMENEMPHVHHAKKWWGCSCIIEDNKGPNEMTWKQIMTF
jgi:hypothetical protein